MSDPIPAPEAGNAARPASGQKALMREVRLGLVCYGGVSLAIYMHGVTKELFKLIRAARAFDRAYDEGDLDPAHWFTGGRDVQGSPDYDSEPAYFAALAGLAGEGHPLTVVLDIVAGTSAGGINGVCLARGLAEGLSLNGFKKLWLEEGDIEGLLAGHALFPWGRAKMWSKLAESAIRLVRHSDAAVLNGDLMSGLLYSALNTMESIGGSLIPADESLDLFVTTTNVYGYDTVIPTGAGGVSHTDKSYRQLLRFHYDQERPGTAPAGKAAPAEREPAVARFATDFTDVQALAFAARATSSFPGAFPPVSLGSFAAALAKADPPAQAGEPGSITRHFVYGSGDETTEAGRWFMDGGVLDNGPFDHVIDAIAAKRADGPTVREIIYLEPDPGKPPAPAQDVPDPEPSFAGTVWASRITIPHHTPLVGVLEQLHAMNTAIAEVGAIVKAQEGEVLTCLQDAGLASTELTGEAGYDDVTGNAATVRAAAQQLTGRLGYATYCRLRAQAVAESFAMSLAAVLGFRARSNRANFVTAAFCAWARQQDTWKAADPVALEAQFGAVDVPFRLRRAEFVLQGINMAFAGAKDEMRPQLAAIKSACWDLLCGLRAVQQQVALDVRDQAMALFGPQALTQAGVLADPEAFAAPDGQGEELSRLFDACLRSVRQAGLPGSSQGLWEAFRQHTGGWDQSDRAGMLSRYVAFPIWDSLIFPVVSLARLPQLTPVTVQRFSPLDATCLQAVDHEGNRKPDPSAKLDGVSIGHFGAFFDRSWRENDYLWGRLDGAELAIRLLARQSGSDLDLTGHLRTALTAILAAEKDSLGQISQVSQALAAQIGEIKTGMPNEHDA